MERISGCVISRNEEDRIGDCLASLAVCDEVVVLDSLSTDRRWSRARRRRQGRAAGVPRLRGAEERVVELARHRWILALDCDERLSPELAAEIGRLEVAGPGGRPG